MLSSVKSALRLLDPRSRRILLLLVAIQVSLSGMDLVGVLLVGAVAALGASAVTGQSPPIVSGFLDTLGLGRLDDVQAAIVLAVAAGLLFITKSFLGFVLLRRSLRFLANRQAMISSRIAGLLLGSPLLQVQRRTSQMTAYALTQGATAATLGVLGNAVVIASEAALLIALAIGLVVLDPIVALFSIAYFAIIGIGLSRLLGAWATRTGQQLAAADIRSIELIQNSLRAYREVAVSGRRGLMAQAFQDLRWTAARFQADSQVIQQVSKYAFEVALVIGAAGLAASQAVTRDAIAAVAIVAVFLTAASRVMPSLIRLQQATVGVRHSAGIASQLIELHDEVQDAPLVEAMEATHFSVPSHGALYPGFRASVVLDSVSVTYPGRDRPSVSDISIQVSEGDSLALVGSTGAGKSTVADIILGVLDPNSGHASLSGLMPSEAIRRWPGAISYVPQDVAIIDGTVRDNVTLGLPRDLVSDEAVWEALDRSHLSQVLKDERNALDTVVGEHGVRLSGGQRQRLGLARALYTQPRLLVLDEATSALDAETERIVSEALSSMTGDVTLVIVAHRLATIRNCTQIAYLENGRLLAVGTFDEVRRDQPRFDRQAELLGL